MGKIKICLLSLLAIVLLTACSKPSKYSFVGEKPTFVGHKEINLKMGKTIAYALFNKDEKLVEFTEKNPYPYDKGIEVIRLTKEGFYTDSYYDDEIECITKKWGDTYSNKLCYSIFSKINTADAVVKNSLFVVTTMGFGVLYGGKISAKRFDYEKFYKLIEENELIKKREELLKAQENKIEPSVLQSAVTGR